MKWQVPAKTFLIGEYAALCNAGAIILTTNPAFEIEISEKRDAFPVHPDSPAGRWWLNQSHVKETSLHWHDPYLGRGGLGASSAQFIGAYLATHYLCQSDAFNYETLLNSYYQCAWQGKGMRPSGYDVLAQVHKGCIYINRSKQSMQCYDWVFTDIAFLLVHTGEKLATHHHLQAINFSTAIEELDALVDGAKLAFEKQDSNLLIQAINSYYDALLKLDLVSIFTQKLIQQLKNNDDVLAVKGCGALGADVLLIVVPMNKVDLFQKTFKEEGRTVLATSQNLYTGNKLVNH